MLMPRMLALAPLALLPLATLLLPVHEAPTYADGDGKKATTVAASARAIIAGAATVSAVVCVVHCHCSMPPRL